MGDNDDSGGKGLIGMIFSFIIFAVLVGVVIYFVINYTIGWDIDERTKTEIVTFDGSDDTVYAKRPAFLVLSTDIDFHIEEDDAEKLDGKQFFFSNTTGGTKTVTLAGTLKTNSSEPSIDVPSQTVMSYIYSETNNSLYFSTASDIN